MYIWTTRPMLTLHQGTCFLLSELLAAGTAGLAWPHQALLCYAYIYLAFSCDCYQIRNCSLLVVQIFI